MFSYGMGRVPYLLEFMGDIPVALEVLVLAAAAVAAVVSLHKFLVVPLRVAAIKMSQAADAMLGYGEVKDPATGRVIQEATPPMAQRVFNLETSQLKTAAALEKLAETMEQLLSISTQVNALQERHMQHEEFVERWMAEHVAEGQRWMEEHQELHIIVAEANPLPTSSVRGPETPKSPH